MKRGLLLLRCCGGLALLRPIPCGMITECWQGLSGIGDVMNDRPEASLESNRQATQQVERFLEATFRKLPIDSKVLVALFGALNSASTLTSGSDLADRLWKSMRFDGCGPLANQSEEVNWLKGVCDGILFIADYA